MYRYIGIKMLAIVLASKDNTMAKHRIYLRANNVSKVKNTVLTEKGDAIMPPLLCMNQEYISTVKSERLPLFWYIH
jgi:hypothetical protein